MVWFSVGGRLKAVFCPGPVGGGVGGKFDAEGVWGAGVVGRLSLRIGVFIAFIYGVSRKLEDISTFAKRSMMRADVETRGEPYTPLRGSGLTTIKYALKAETFTIPSLAVQP